MQKHCDTQKRELIVKEWAASDIEKEQLRSKIDTLYEENPDMTNEEYEKYL